MIHHSDRGMQYCSTEYVQLLQQHHAMISMTEKGDPYENAVAERMNGILKEELLSSYYDNIDTAPCTLPGASPFTITEEDTRALTGKYLMRCTNKKDRR